MIRADGKIIGTRRYNRIGFTETVDITWEGGDEIIATPEFLTEIGYNVSSLRPGDTVVIGPYTMIFVSMSVYDNARLVRDYGPIATLREALQGIPQFIGLIYRRIIVTLAVWGFADYRTTDPPSWREVYAIQWVLDKIQALRTRSQEI